MKRYCFVALWIVGICLSHVAFAVQYELVDIGRVSSFGPVLPMRINDAGQVVGTYQPSIQNIQAFCWKDGQYTLLPDSGTVVSHSASAFGINNSGVIVGMDGSSPVQWSWQKLFMGYGWQKTALNTLGQNSTGAARDINNSNRSIGNLTDAGPIPSPCAYNAVYWDSVNPVVIDASSFAPKGVYMSDINNAGQIVGYSSEDYTPTVSQAFIREINGTITPLGVLAGDVKSCANAVNDAGRVVGYSENTNENRRAFSWQNNTLTELLAAGQPCEAAGLNEQGITVGNFWQSESPRACVWQNSNFYNLNSLLAPEFSNWTLEYTYDINESGWIVASGISPAGQTGHAVVLVPIPEPVSLSLLAVGALLIRRRRIDKN